jgi:hypothetical protein
MTGYQLDYIIRHKDLEDYTVSFDPDTNSLIFRNDEDKTEYDDTSIFVLNIDTLYYQQRGTIKI